MSVGLLLELESEVKVKNWICRQISIFGSICSNERKEKVKKKTHVSRRRRSRRSRRRRSRTRRDGDGAHLAAAAGPRVADGPVAAAELADRGW